ncbi:hypothetical protein Y88_0054 [Novosphingobium nitrogenifigens DSM 19370]|uniref:Uncharacterized protein n=1 Tax=Novosphingobium nitrogenifigens DSM 19370 TaxID=983920 RepID=F1Z4Q6_9SPHN|nr:hypothetical protein Y88_0054 [Novosphingobium nitrogenifigens DSM 19370]
MLARKRKRKGSDGWPPRCRSTAPDCKGRACRANEESAPCHSAR